MNTPPPSPSSSSSPLAPKKLYIRCRGNIDVHIPDCMVNESFVLYEVAYRNARLSDALVLAPWRTRREVLICMHRVDAQQLRHLVQSSVKRNQTSSVLTTEAIVCNEADIYQAAPAMWLLQMLLIAVSLDLSVSMRALARVLQAEHLNGKTTAETYAAFYKPLQSCLSARANQPHIPVQ